tara:strand:- start:16412 stop:16624 length:213 start_codon:yes stop_codon:yes gene_type:complete
MTWKQYLSEQGFMYSELNGDWRKGKGFGQSVKVAMIMRGLFEIKKNDKVVFSHFIESFDEFKDKIKELEV